MHIIKSWLADDYTITKCSLGILLIAGGLVIVVGAVAFDRVAGDGNFGPSQQLAFVAGVVTVVAGITLLPLGDQLA